MRRVRLLPRLVNRKDGDPGLLVELSGLGRYYLFDCGSNERIPKADLLRISSVFVTHTHIDHWIGFDRLLRHSLGDEREIHVYGPEGLLANLEGKFHGYLWNLQEAGPDFIGHEISGGAVRSRRFPGARQFRGEAIEEGPLGPGGLVSSDQGVFVRCAPLEHRTTTLGYAVHTEPFPSVRADALRQLGLREGPWLSRLKEAAGREIAAGETIDVDGAARPLAELAEKLLEMRPADKIAYVTDTIFNERTLATVSELARDATAFFCEANFRDDDEARAAYTCHLTAGQAARFALGATAARLVLFHISRKYSGDFTPSLEQARSVFGPNVE